MEVGFISAFFTTYQINQVILVEPKTDMLSLI